MATHTKRITAAVTPEIDGIYESLSTATGRTVSSLASDVLLSRATEARHFTEWLDEQAEGSPEWVHGRAAAQNIAVVSLIDAIREVDPAYRTPEEVLQERKDQGEAILRLMDGATLSDEAERLRLAGALLEARDEVSADHAKLRAAKKREREVLSMGYAGSTSGRRR